MYNLACNYRTITVMTLLPLIRCKVCAEALAEETGRDLGEDGCGVYPLTLTLRQMNRREDDPVPNGVTAYKCGVPDCDIRRRPEDMYNLKIGRTPETIAMVLPFIRCGDHARAAAKGKEPCTFGSGVFRLSHTLRWLRNANKRT